MILLSKTHWGLWIPSLLLGAGLIVVALILLKSSPPAASPSPTASEEDAHIFNQQEEPAKFPLVKAEPQSRQSSKIANIVEQLVYNSYEARAAGLTDLSGLSNAVLNVTHAGEIELLFHAADATGAGEEADLEALGATIVGRLEISPELKLRPAGMIQAWVPYDKVQAAAALQWVVAVTPPSYGEVDPHPTNPINSEGVELHDADLVHELGITGDVVTVGVISNGVVNLAASQALNELPAVTVFSCGCR